MIVFILVMYFFLIRSQNKKKKQEEEMKKNINIGDVITTIGGITGRVVAVRDEDDEIILETGADRVKIRFKKWCIYSNDTAMAQAEEAKKKEAAEKAKAKEEKKAAKKREKEQ